MDPFSIPFETAYTFAEDFTPSDYYTAKPLPYVNCRLVNFAIDQLNIAVQSQGQKIYTVRFTVSSNQLQIDCTCKPVNQLCVHGWHALHELCWDTKDFFKLFASEGLVQIAIENKKLFHTDHTHLRNFIAQDMSLGYLYTLDRKPMEHPTFSTMPATSIPVNELALTWLIAYTPRQWQKRMPTLLPVAGKLNKIGDTIKSFYRAFAEENTLLFANTPNREQLYIESTKMYTAILKKGKSDIGITNILSPDKYLMTHYNQWTALLPLLAQEPFIYKYNLAHPRYYIKQAPHKSFLRKIRIATAAPQLQFILKKKNNYHQLSLQFLVHGSPLTNTLSDALFFVYSGDQYFLLSSYRDVATMHWMEYHSNMITVMDIHFSKFEKEVLQPLAACYTIIRR